MYYVSCFFGRFTFLGRMPQKGVTCKLILRRVMNDPCAFAATTSGGVRSQAWSNMNCFLCCKHALRWRPSHSNLISFTVFPSTLLRFCKHQNHPHFFSEYYINKGPFQAKPLKLEQPAQVRRPSEATCSVDGTQSPCQTSPRDCGCEIVHSPEDQ